MVYRLTISYRGTAYAGWQRQPGVTTVQQTVEEAIAALAGETPSVAGAGRTDAGVHARGQVARVELARVLPSRALVHGVNHHLPEDIRILAARRISPRFDARRSALSKEYVYRLVRAPVLSPLDALFAVRVAPDLDLEAMAAAARALVGRHDFTAFALAGGAHRQPFRTVFEAGWEEAAGGGVRFRIVGDGFLRGMVRSIVGTLLETGRGRRPPESVAALLTGAPRAAAGPTAPAAGLTLERVLYPSEWGERGAAEPAAGEVEPGERVVD